MMLIGQRVLRQYEVVDLIAEGGQACVAKGQNRKSREFVAIRQLNSKHGDSHHETAMARFRREALLSIEHPSVLRTIEWGEDGGSLYMVLPFIEGLTLEEKLAREAGRLSAASAARVMTQVAAALQACHRAGVVHRDVKPANVLIDDVDRAYLIDFGICSLANESTLTDGNCLLGTLHWLAPEQVLDPKCRDPRLDLYALGAVLYFALTGRYVVEGHTPEEIVLSICKVDPKPPSRLIPTIPAPLDHLCQRLLAKNPNDRFQCASEVCSALAQTGLIHQKWNRCFSCGHASGGRFCGRCGAQAGATFSAASCFACGATVGSESACSACSRSFGAVDHRLEFRSGPLSGHLFRVPEGAYRVGRNELAPRDFHISRVQLIVVCTHGRLCVSDADSRNRTLVDGHPTQGTIQLVPGQTVRIGLNEAKYFIP